MKKNVEFLCDEVAKMGITLSEKQIDQFMLFYEMLIEKNKVMNLTAITEFEDVVYKHFIDSIYISKVFDLEKVNTMIDVGTGAGFPGIPIKILNPDLSITLLDSLNKRVNFLNEVINSLELDNIMAIHGRAEDIARNEKNREQYDLCVSRAVANLSSLSEYCLPFVKKGGHFISYKSGECDNEINDAKHAIYLLGGKLENVEKFNILEKDISRSFVIINKENGTPKKYPRKAGVPSKEPLK